DLALDIEDGLHIEAFGLDANIAGHLGINQRPGGSPRANGTLTVSKGTFSRYGQTLNIERGRLIYSGPL
ncbi:MAG: hypothetical protein GWN87_08300, partial [Desulfuromonadales bacterium]|nr:hypothetical protein [Desulfuromonadales bacterium]